MRTDVLESAIALSDDDLLERIQSLARTEREATAELVAHLAALEMRPNAYAAQGYGSLFDYCTGGLHLSEDAACNRIAAARLCRAFPTVLDRLTDGSLTLTAVRLLKAHITEANHEAVLARAAHASKEQIEVLIAELAPKADVPATVRRLPLARAPLALPATLDDGSSPPTAVAAVPAPSAPPAVLPLPRPSRAVVQPLAPERYRVQFTIGQETRDRLRRVQDLLRREVPNGDAAILFDRALRLLEDAERRKRGLGTTMMSAAEAKARRTRGGRNYEKRIRSGTDASPTERPRQEEEKEPTAGDELRRVRGESEEEVGPQPTVPAASRHIPNAVKAAVWRRDRGQCAFVSDGGHRCTQRSFLELHHLRPYALAGRATARNIALRCRRHNQYEGELVFGSRPPSSALTIRPPSP